MSITETVQDRLEQTFVADTGATGLNNSASSAYVRFWKPYRDPFVDQANGPGNWPAVLTKVDVQPMHSSGCMKYRVRASFVVRLDRQVTHADATTYLVINQIALVMAAAAWTEYNDYCFSPWTVLDEQEGPRSSVAIEQILTAECYASR